MDHKVFNRWIQGITGQGFLPERGIAGTSFNNQVRYNILDGSGVKIDLMSTGKLHAGLTWIRSGTTLTITSNTK